MRNALFPVMAALLLCSCAADRYAGMVSGSGTLEATQVNVGSKVVGRISALYAGRATA